MHVRDSIPTGQQLDGALCSQVQTIDSGGSPAPFIGRAVLVRPRLWPGLSGFPVNSLSLQPESLSPRGEGSDGPTNGLTSSPGFRDTHSRGCRGTNFREPSTVVWSTTSVLRIPQAAFPRGGPLPGLKFQRTGKKKNTQILIRPGLGLSINNHLRPRPLLLTQHSPQVDWAGPDASLASPTFPGLSAAEAWLQSERRDFLSGWG